MWSPANTVRAAPQPVGVLSANFSVAFGPAPSSQLKTARSLVTMSCGPLLFAPAGDIRRLDDQRGQRSGAAGGCALEALTETWPTRRRDSHSQHDNESSLESWRNYGTLRLMNGRLLVGAAAAGAAICLGSVELIQPRGQER